MILGNQIDEKTTSKVIILIVVIAIIAIVSGLYLQSKIQSGIKTNNQTSTSNVSNHTVSTNYSVSNHSASNQSLIAPGNEPYAACPAPVYENQQSTINATPGLTYSNVSGTPDYVISPGSSGYINYSVSLGAGTFNRSIVRNESNIAIFYHSGPYNATSPTHLGLNFSFQPENEEFMVNSSYMISSMINASSNASLGTYWVALTPGICGGGAVFLLTVGNQAYNGTILNHVVPP